MLNFIIANLNRRHKIRLELNGLKMLVIDDDICFLNLLSEVIRSRGWECDTASSVKIAQDCLQKSNYQTICIDFSLRDGTAIDVLWFIRSHRIACRALVLSGHDDSHTRDLALKAGAESYIIKGETDFLEKICGSKQ